MRIRTATTPNSLKIQNLLWHTWKSAKFLVEIAASLMARFRIDELKFGDVSQLIGLLGKIAFSPFERGKINLPTKGPIDKALPEGSTKGFGSLG